MSDKKITAMDGNAAAGYVGYMMSEVAAIYPITPSSPMAEYGDELAASGKKNIFGRTVKIAELQSEGGAAGAVHGSLAAGAMTTTYTASQGLLLMIPNMYKIAGEKLPSVFHVSARTIAMHALSIFGDHTDVMATRQTGFIMLASNNSQEVMDLAFISHIATYKAHLPILHFFDGFRTSHEISKVEILDEALMRSMIPMDEINAFKARAHNPEHPKQTGTAQNSDIWFQAAEASNKYYDKAYDIINDVMIDFGNKTGRLYKPFQYEGATNATSVVILMGSGCDTVGETVKYLNANDKKVGVLKVHLYRPFNASALIQTLPTSVKKITVLDRTKEPGSLGEPLYLDVVAALNEFGLTKKIKCLAGRYGLAGKEFLPEHVVSIFKNMHSGKPMNHFTVGIEDDVTHLSLPIVKNFKGLGSQYFEMKFFGLGSDGTVSANKSSIKIVADLTSKYVQGYFEYDSKKSGSLTTSHLRISDNEFYAPYLVKNANFIAIHNYAFISQYDVLNGLKNGGNVLLNTSLTEEQLARDLPEQFKKHLKQTNAKLYTIPAFDVARTAGLGNRINVIMQACFFKITNIIPYSKAEEEMKKFATKAYAKKGEKILVANMKAIDAATTDLHEINVERIIKTKTKSFVQPHKMSEYFKNWVNKINARHGDEMKVSEFTPDGSVPNGTTQYEKRGIGLNIPVWNPTKCVQCGQCALVCPHGVIRSFLVSNDKLTNTPNSLQNKVAIADTNAKFIVQCSPLDCTGCESCARTCPANKMAKEGEPRTLVMTPLRDALKDQEINWEFIHNIEQVKQTKFAENTVLGVQFKKPYFEFSGACAGCGETPYVTLISRLFGDSMMIANATGCSSIYGGSAPSNPYTVDKDGHGPTWANSLFEDNAEFGYGMRLATDYMRSEVFDTLNKIAQTNTDASSAINELITVKDKYESRLKAKNVIDLLKSLPQTDEIKKVLSLSDQLPKKSQWIIGGDGWAYDIGYGGLDHVIAQNENVNILVLDTEVYSNTGGQASKSTPAGSVAKFAANGKVTRKKDLGLIAMSYKHVYVAQVSMGANPAQLIKALVEAESYDGPSLIIAYAPCINHGINMSNAQAEMKKAVDTGYWTLYRYDPRNASAPLTIDSPEPTKTYQEFLDGEQRYVSLMKKSPEHAKILFEASAREATERRETLKRIVASQQKIINIL